MVLSHVRVFLSSSPSSSLIGNSVDVEVEKPKKVGRPRKKKEVESVVEDADEPTLNHGDCMTASHIVAESPVDPQSQNFESQKSSYQSYDDDNSEQDDGYYEDETNDEGDDGQMDASLAHNQMLVTLSYSLLSQVKQMARMEGVSPDDIIIELIAEGVTKRAFQEINRPKPSHLMTRTGYVPPEANGNTMAQPLMSHHMQQQQQGNGGGRNQQGGGNRRFGNGGGQQHNGNNNMFQNRGGQNPRFGGGGVPNQNRNGGNQNSQNVAYQAKNQQRNKKSFNPNFQRNANSNGGALRPQNVNGFVSNENGPSYSDKDGDE